MSDRKAARDVCIERPKRYEQTDKSYRNALEDEKQLQRNHQERKNMECCKNAQPVFDSERQLAGKVVDEKAIELHFCGSLETFPFHFRTDSAPLFAP